MTSRKPLVALIDADPIVYACGFTAQHTEYLIADEKNILWRKPLEGKKDMNEALEYCERRYNKGRCGPPVVWERLRVEPPSHACQSAKVQLESILEALESWSKREVDYELYLTGSGNFREQIATIKPYKGTRKPWHKPRLEREIKEYLTNNWGAETIYGQEADDELAIRQLESKEADCPSIIVSIDKDLMMVPGWHYNPTKGEFHKTSPEEGLVLFYRQILTGDVTDNIMGCYKLGVARATKIIKDGMSEEDMWETVKCIFVDNMRDYPDRYPSDMDYEEAALETARLVWMRSKPDEIWEPPE